MLMEIKIFKTFFNYWENTILNIVGTIYIKDKTKLREDIMTKIKKKVTNKKRGGCNVSVINKSSLVNAGVINKCEAKHIDGTKCNKALNHDGSHSTTDGHEWKNESL